MILLKIQVLQSVNFFLFPLYFTHCLVHYLRINLADKMYLLLYWVTYFCLHHYIIIHWLGSKWPMLQVLTQCDCESSAWALEFYNYSHSEQIFLFIHSTCVQKYRTRSQLEKERNKFLLLWMSHLALMMWIFICGQYWW